MKKCILAFLSTVLVLIPVSWGGKLPVYGMENLPARNAQSFSKFLVKNDYSPKY